MDRCGVFIDAGHLLAEGGKLVCGVGSRSRLTCDYAGVVSAITDFAQTHSRLNLLRSYWYDGAQDAIPTRDHLFIGTLPYVKLRLGRVSRGAQKGVDSLIVRDLMTLAKERAIATIILLAGDEDLREGVIAAQDLGVRVILLGVATGSADRWNQAATLVRESDEHIVLPHEFWKPFFRSNAITSPETSPLTNSSITIASVGTTFAQTWLDKATPEELVALLSKRPQIPQPIDVQLLEAAEEAQSVSMVERTEARKALRAAFWEKVSRFVDESNALPESSSLTSNA